MKMALRVCLALLLPVALGLPAKADGSNIWWPGWSVQSSEDLSNLDTLDRPLLHPLTALFDGDPKTTWVFNSKATPTSLYVRPNDNTVWELFPKSKLGLLIEGAHWTSGIRILNGNNSSPDAYASSNRILGLRVVLMRGQHKETHFVPLGDKMGWHYLYWPRQFSNSIAVEFLMLARKNQPVCASEIGFLDGSRNVDPKMPHAVMFYNGLESEGGAYLLTLNGHPIADVASGLGYEEKWSSDRQFVAGFDGVSVWVASAKRGTLVRKINLDRKLAENGDEEADYKWLSGHRLQIEFTRSDAHNNWKPFKTKTYQF